MVRGARHVEHPTRGNTLNPARMDYVQANDTCSSATHKAVRSPIRSKGSTTIGRSAITWG